MSSNFWDVIYVHIIQYFKNKSTQDVIETLSLFNWLTINISLRNQSWNINIKSGQFCKSNFKKYLADLAAIYDIIICFNQFYFDFYKTNPRYLIFNPYPCISLDKSLEFVII